MCRLCALRFLKEETNSPEWSRVVGCVFLNTGDKTTPISVEENPCEPYDPKVAVKWLEDAEAVDAVIKHTILLAFKDDVPLLVNTYQKF